MEVEAKHSRYIPLMPYLLPISDVTKIEVPTNAAHAMAKAKDFG